MKTRNKAAKIDRSNQGTYKNKARLSLDLSQDNTPLHGKTIAEEDGPICVCIGSYNQFTPYVPVLIKYPHGTEKQLGFDFSKTHQNYAVETFYCIQQRISDATISVRPLIAFSAEEVKKAKVITYAPEDQRAAFDSDEIKAASRLAYILDYGWDANNLTSDQNLLLDGIVNAEQDDTISNMNETETFITKKIDVKVYKEIDPTSSMQLEGKDNDKIIIHGERLSPDNLKLSSASKSDTSFMTSFVVIHPDVNNLQGRIVLTVHRVVEIDVAKKIEGKLNELANSNAQCTLETLPVQLQEFNFPELARLKQAVQVPMATPTPVKQQTPAPQARMSHAPTMQAPQNNTAFDSVERAVKQEIERLRDMNASRAWYSLFAAITTMGCTKKAKKIEDALMRAKKHFANAKSNSTDGILTYKEKNKLSLKEALNNPRFSVGSKPFGKKGTRSLENVKVRLKK